SGTVNDSNTKFIAYANVVLVSKEDSEIIKGTITDDFGAFKIDNIDIGDYTITLSFLGFEDYSKAIALNQNIDLGIIILKESLQELDGVTIVAKRPTVKRMVDRLVFNVENSTLSNNNVLDVLKHTPGVLVNNEEAEWTRVLERYDAVCKKAKANDVAVLIDAEESWMQDACDALITNLMIIYNTEKPIVYNTLQMYRHDRLAFLEQEHKKAKKGNYFLGFKLVRGAYLEKENERAVEKGYKSPICDSKFETDQNFNNGVHYIMDHLDCMSLFAGTHNEDSSYLLMTLMNEKKILNNDPRIWFGQLYGMSDHISFNLANKGYNVAKYVPFGPVKDVMPYLIRRAEENTSVAGQTGRELALIKKEKKRRK
ncbi:proline dehydrogenase family protein, partial [Algibacter sp.]|nr:proline dehydrogenase family protein [Algibacter sp.]